MKPWRSCGTTWRSEINNNSVQSSVPADGPEQLLAELKSSLARSLQIGSRVDEFTADTRLLGELPELDSMTILNVIMALEEHFGITIEDDDVDAETFATVGTLLEFVDSKLG